MYTPCTNVCRDTTTAAAVCVHTQAVHAVDVHNTQQECVQWIQQSVSTSPYGYGVHQHKGQQHGVLCVYTHKHIVLLLEE